MLSVDIAKTPVSPGPAPIRIGMVLERPLQHFSRVAREAEALAKAGYQVFLLCPRTDDEEPVEEQLGGLTIYRAAPEEAVYRLPLLNKETRAPMEGWLYRAALKLWNVDTVWQALMRDFVQRYDIQILHVHELPLANTGMSVANKFQIPLVSDLGRDYSAWLSAHGGTAGEKSAARWADLETIATYGADQIIVASNASRIRLVSKGTPEHKVMVLPDVPNFSRYESVPIDSEVIRCFKSTFLMTYAGPVGASYSGLNTLLEAMRLLAAEIPELQLVCIGELNDADVDSIHARVAQAGLEGRVHICREFQSDSALVSCIEAADFCVYPVQENDWTRSQVPEEIYLYQSFRKPVIASSFGEIKAYLEPQDSGLLARDAQGFAAGIRQLYEETDTRRRLSANGLKAIRAQADTQYEGLNALLALYRELSLPLVQYGAR